MRNERVAAQRKPWRNGQAEGGTAPLPMPAAAALVRIEQSMIDTLPIGVVLLRADPAGRWIITSVNQMFEQLARTERRFAIGGAGERAAQRGRPRRKDL